MGKTKNQCRRHLFDTKFWYSTRNVCNKVKTILNQQQCPRFYHDDVIKWKNFPRYWPFVKGIHRQPVNSPYKGQWRGALMLPLICAWINGWANNREAGDLSYDVIVMNRTHLPVIDRVLLLATKPDASAEVVRSYVSCNVNSARAQLCRSS